MKVGFRDMAQMEEWHGTPQHPHELIHHRCIGWRKEPGASPYRWEFAEQGRDFDVAVNPQLTTNDMGVMVRTACAGGGIALAWRRPFCHTSHAVSW